MAKRVFKVWRGDIKGGDFTQFDIEVDPGMVVLDVLHRIQAQQAQRPRAALELQGRQVRLVLDGDQRQAAAGVHDADEQLQRRRDHHLPAAQDVPGDEGSRHRRVVELRAEQADPEVQAQAARRRRYVPHVPGGRRPRAGVPQVHRVLPVPGRLPRAARSRQAGRSAPRPASPPRARSSGRAS